MLIVKVPKNGVGPEAQQHLVSESSGSGFVQNSGPQLQLENEMFCNEEDMQEHIQSTRRMFTLSKKTFIVAFYAAYLQGCKRSHQHIVCSTSEKI